MPHDTLTEETVQDTTRVLFVDFTDVNDAPIDPVAVSLKITAPDETVTNVTSGFDQPTLGRFEHKFKFAQDGTYRYSWFGETVATESSIAKKGIMTVEPR